MNNNTNFVLDMILLVVFLIIKYYSMNLTNIEIENKHIMRHINNQNIIDQIPNEILNLINDGIIITNKNFTICYMNSISKDLFTEIYEEIFKNGYLEVNLLNVFPQMIILQSEHSKIFKNRRLQISISDNNSPDRLLEFKINTLICNNQFHHIFTVQQTIEQKKSLSKNKFCLIAYLSHELRNPLQSITLANHLIGANMKVLEDSSTNEYVNKNKSYLETVSRSCRDMKKIINDILDLTRIESNEFIIELDVCSINDIIIDIISEHQIIANEKEIEIRYQINSDVPNTLYTDPTRIVQILNNLLSNAIKYSKKEGKIDIEVKYDSKNRGIIFNVIDFGIGIKKEEIGNLFKDYGQTSNSFKLGVTSHGLGLCVSNKIAHLLGGNITVKSKYGDGSIFSLYHPINLGQSGLPTEKSNIDGSLSGNILLVDDNESNLSLLHIVLDNLNLEYQSMLKIESVSDGKDAIEICKINQYDIIFMDINMKGIDGCTASKIIRKNGFNGSIIATTGNILLKAENKDFIGLEIYNIFDDIIIKPFDNIAILKVLRKFLLENK